MFGQWYEQIYLRMSRHLCNGEQQNNLPAVEEGSMISVRDSLVDINAGGLQPPEQSLFLSNLTVDSLTTHGVLNAAKPLASITFSYRT